jgi:hypothetical protein
MKSNEELELELEELELEDIENLIKNQQAVVSDLAKVISKHPMSPRLQYIGVLKGLLIASAEADVSYRMLQVEFAAALYLLAKHENEKGGFAE